VAVFGFFVMAFIGWLSGVPEFTSAIRASAGAAVLFVIVKSAGRMIANIFADAITGNAAGRRSKGRDI